LSLRQKLQYLLLKLLQCVAVLLEDAEVDLVVVAIPADADPVLLASVQSSSRQH
jgi:hypothetical protein